MKVVGIYIQDSTTLEYNRVDLFDDEKISVTSSIQNINDIAKTYTDFSQTFTVPASKQNNKIFKHWYDNSNDYPFSTLTKSNAYIEIDTIPFRSGKIQLESANVVDGQAQDYSITFIGILGNLKDTFAGKYLKDLTSTAYDFNYSAGYVGALVLSNNASADIMFPLISSDRRWIMGSSTASTDDINNPDYPIRYNELFPAIRLRAVLNMIETQFGINFDGTVDEPSTFLSDPRFTNAYLYLKNMDEFKTNLSSQIDFTTKGNLEDLPGVTVNLTDNYFVRENGGRTRITIIPQAGFTTVPYTVKRYLNEQVWDVWTYTGTLTTDVRTDADSNKHSFYIESNQEFQFVFTIDMALISTFTKSATMNPQSNTSYISIRSYFPEIKIEDFFSGLLKMFNLTCYSSDGINYTVEQLESYYVAGSDIDITKYVLQDKKALNRVKTYKRINFEYEKSESFINVGFNSLNGIEYGSLYYQNPTQKTEGEEYSVKLPFEDLNFNSLSGQLQVGYCLKTDNQKYIPKPIILYDYNPLTLTYTGGQSFQWSNQVTGTGTGFSYYKAFGQETLAYSDIWSLNFPSQQSTLTNQLITNSLYETYYSKYFNNIYNYKARLVKVSAILPTSILTTLKLNDNIIIRHSKYLINSYTTDLTTGLVQFELLTDQRQ